MATRARQPRKKGESTQPEILRAIRLGDKGDVYGPGEEDEFLEALEEHVDEHNKQAARLAKAGQAAPEELDVQKELHRLHVLGHLVNFKGVDVTDDDLEEPDQDLTANRKANQRAQVTAPGDETEGAEPIRRVKRRTQATKGVQSNKGLKRLNDGADEPEEKPPEK